MTDQHTDDCSESSALAVRANCTLNKSDDASLQSSWDEWDVLASMPAGPGQRRYGVGTIEGSIVPFVVSTSASPQDFFETVCKFFCLNEKKYFGLRFRDETNTFYWLNNEKKLDKQLKKKGQKLELMVKFYPPDPEDLREHITRHLITLQLRQNMMAELLPCSEITYAVLGSYLVQSELGDIKEDQMRSLDYLKKFMLCPESQHCYELLFLVRNLHGNHRGMLPEEADVQFLINAKKLAMYGVDLHQARDAQGEEGLVGVYHGGVVVYRNSVRINRFSWPKIFDVSFTGNVLKLSIKTSSSEGDPKHKKPTAVDTVVKFKSPNKKLCKRLWRAIVEHRRFFRYAQSKAAAEAAAEAAALED